jgi:hypothetical protein
MDGKADWRLKKAGRGEGRRSRGEPGWERWGASYEEQLGQVATPSREERSSGARPKLGEAQEDDSMLQGGRWLALAEVTRQQGVFAAAREGRLGCGRPPGREG